MEEQSSKPVMSLPIWSSVRISTNRSANRIARDPLGEPLDAAIKTNTHLKKSQEERKEMKAIRKRAKLSKKRNRIEMSKSKAHLLKFENKSSEKEERRK